LKWWIKNRYIPRKPGIETLDCRGYHCQCRVVNANGETIL